MNVPIVGHHARTSVPSATFELSDFDRAVVSAGVLQQGAVARPSEALAQAYGFLDRDDLIRHTGPLLGEMIRRGMPIATSDLHRTVGIAAVAIADSYRGIGRNWFPLTGIEDEDAIRALRRVQEIAWGLPAGDGPAPVVWRGHSDAGEPDIEVLAKKFWSGFEARNSPSFTERRRVFVGDLSDVHFRIDQAFQHPLSGDRLILAIADSAPVDTDLADKLSPFRALIMGRTIGGDTGLRGRLQQLGASEAILSSFPKR
jgi:hypothetical protein